MSPQQTASYYDKIAHHWAQETFSPRYGILQYEKAIQFSNKSGDAIDVGCGGGGRFIDLLQSHHFVVEGLDISSEMIAIAKKKHPDVLFYQADICDWEFPKKYDFISAWDSIWHVPLHQQADLLKKLCEGLNSNGVLIFTAGGIDGPHEVTNEQSLYHATLGIPQLLRLIGDCGCICRHLEYDQYPESHLYLIVQRPK